MVCNQEHDTEKAALPEFILKEVEIMGNSQHSREEILAHIPLHVGDPFARRQELWNEWCSKLVEMFDLHDATAGVIWHIDGMVSFIVDVVERGAEHRSKFRSAPIGLPQQLPDSVMSLYDDLASIQDELQGRGETCFESISQGYLDYSESRMHEIVLQLIEAVPPYREALLDIVAIHRDAETRAAAATMLHWAGEVSKSIAIVHRLLDDPDQAVRNNISRFMIQYLGQLSSCHVRQGVIDALLTQLDRPSGTDRNKAIYGLLRLAQSFEVDRTHIAQRGLDIIRDMERNSVMNNQVRNPARELLDLVE